MSDELEAVRQTGRRWTAVNKAREQARDAHFDAVVAALRAGEAPTEVAQRSPFTATTLRCLARGADIPPAKRRPRPSRKPD